jgi:hypothetical protein
VGAEAARLFDPAQAPAALNEAAELGAKLVAAEAGRGIPEQAAAMAAGRDSMRQLVTRMRDHWGYEYGVWQVRGR